MHIQGHEGHPWNCVADHLANLVGLDKWGPCFVPPVWAEATKYETYREWEWLDRPSQQNLGAFP
eukprot:7638684-Pyramimonas_sp.AAC.1